MYETLIDAQTVAAHVDDPDWVIVDCRFDLADEEAGRTAYTDAHIPGAVYAHLTEELSSEPVTDRGRHPLPSPAVMTRRFGELGINREKQVVVYDDKNGAYAARLWWMLRFMGHRAAAVLDGGWQAWQDLDLPTRGGREENARTLFVGAPQLHWLVQIDEVPGQALLVDSRAAERYRGETEPFDPRAGHIPGAVNYFYQENWGPNGRYLSPEALRENFAALLGDVAPQEATFYCGSGVTACVNLLAMAHAGLGDGRLYVGSWSEWSRDPERPAAVGE